MSSRLRILLLVGGGVIMIIGVTLHQLATGQVKEVGNTIAIGGGVLALLGIPGSGMKWR